MKYSKTAPQWILAERQGEMEILFAKSAEQKEVALALIVRDDQARAALLDDARHDRIDTSGLVIALHQSQVVAAAWGQVFPGRVALLWSPYLAGDLELEFLKPVLSAVELTLQAGGVRLIQSLLPPQDRRMRQFLAHAGYEVAADLLYLYVDVAQAAPKSLDDLELVSARQLPRATMADVVERTYQGTLDCPALNGTRSAEEVLDGYQSLGKSGDQWWWLVREPGQDFAGCLFLADHADQQQVELVYVGVVPSHRGRGWGRTLTDWSAALAREIGRARLVLAVDANNQPALEAYLSLGMQSWDTQRVYLKSLGA